ncbi:ABC transporter ATP-binding protein [Fodinicurvata sp. CAU 1616]|uniref:ABC transporter ATP-binding protein n=1 Tax=Aquibaculum arenosum TaxID=3032591 RepID=A0ABT5YN19_9PROT|nr:ABC transporter ATP-binding protein [Fodinicurvata sp. CAU 1616]
MIQVEHLSKSFGGLRAVNDCSFTLEEGAITGLIGPNGAGKTTVFNMIAGFIKPSGGRILFEGQDVTGFSPERLFSLGIVRTFQIPHEFSRMTVLENLMLVPPAQSGENLFSSWLRWGAVRREERDVRRKGEEVLEFLELTHVRDELAGNLSGGQKKLLELGRTMMTDAKLVLLDEPAAGVNRTLMGKLARMIQQLHRERGYSFCIIEHDMDLIAELCHPVIVLAEGRVLTQGSMESIRRDERVLEAYLGHSGAHETEGAA